MMNSANELERLIHVVMFGSGPALTHDARKFLCRLEAHPDIELLGAYIQSESQNLGAIIKDLWRRRGMLALPLLIAWIANNIGRFLSQPYTEVKMRRAMASLSERVHFVTDIHSQEVLDEIWSLTPDLGLIYGGPILKSKLFEIPKLGTLGIHHGKVPDYRGNKTTFWAIYNGEKTAGVTIQKVNTGLDTGDILKEGEVTIGRRSQRAIWRELEELGLDLYVQAILEVKQGKAKYKPQVGKRGKLYYNPNLRDLFMFYWRQLNRRVGRI